MRFFGLITASAITCTTLSALPTVESPKDIATLFPSNEVEVTKYGNRVGIKYEAYLSDLIRVPQEKRSYETVLKIWDTMEGEYQYGINLFDALLTCSPHAPVQDAAAKAKQKLENTRLSLLYGHPEFYDVLNAVPYGELSKEKQYFFAQIREKLKKNGFHLTTKERKELQVLFSEVFELQKNFQKNISSDSRYIVTSADKLEGVSLRILSGLTQVKEGQYQLTTDYPTYLPILKSCRNEETRKALHEVFGNRGYPYNQKVLEKLVAARAKIAQILGYASFAEMDIKTEMAQSPQRVHQFLFDLSKKIEPKAAQEISILKQNLPQGIQLTKEKKIKEWDFSYIVEQVNQNIHQISNEAITEYFPLETTLAGLVHIYEEFFNLSIVEMPIEGMWSDEVRLLQINEKNGKFTHGYILLDLHPRPNKYTHACMIPLLPAYSSEQSTQPATALLLCNFARPTNDAPALMSHSDVTTFFHEFGHGLHHLFCRSDLTSATLDALSADFVELPSQLLEEWLWEPNVLRTISRHYKTGLPLPNETISKMIDARRFSIGLNAQRQCALSIVSLSLFEENKQSDPNRLFTMLHEQFYPHVELNPDGHSIMSFTHLNNYGARYYGYLWSKILASDLFEKIKGEGLLNPQAGTLYRKTILMPGPLKDPNEMVKEFLGREPTQSAYLLQIGA